MLVGLSVPRPAAARQAEIPTQLPGDSTPRSRRRRPCTVGLTATVHGRSHQGQEQLGEALRTVIRMARASVSVRSTEELLGRIGPFELYVFIGREFDDVHLYLKGEAMHDCRPCQTGLALY